MFHQVEGLWIDENISFADLEGRLHRLPAPVLRDRRPAGALARATSSFTEPSAEIDMKFESGPLKGKWLEISGSGQVHPDRCAISASTPSAIGFAFGSGLERLTMLRYGIGDLRLFFEGDCAF